MASSTFYTQPAVQAPWPGAGCAISSGHLPHDFEKLIQFAVVHGGWKLGGNSNSRAQQQQSLLATIKHHGTAVQVFKFAIYVAIPVTLTFYVAQNPDLLSSIIKNVRDSRSGAAKQAS